MMYDDVADLQAASARLDRYIIEAVAERRALQAELDSRQRATPPAASVERRELAAAVGLDQGLVAELFRTIIF